MNEDLKRLMVNLKNHSWNVFPHFKIDENEGKKILAALQIYDMACKDARLYLENGTGPVYTGGTDDV